MVEANSESWTEGEDEETDSESYPVEYSVVSSPNDFNMKTMYDFIKSKVIEIPDFQRNYVWDIKRASKLIESIVMGLPIPQIFLYEKERNKFTVIDGQQRLMTIYYFMSKRFPKMEKRIELRRIFDEQGEIPENVLADNAYFEDFNLELQAPIIDKINRLSEKNYSTLPDKTTFELRVIRNIIIKQFEPKDDASIMYEIFYRLNTGGINLKPQEIRSSVYHSEFFNMLRRINLDNRWRRITRKEPDIHMKDVEIILRGFAILISGDTYKPSMIQFLNEFSNRRKQTSNEECNYLEKLFGSFLDKCSVLPDNAFTSKTLFNVSMYEAVFNAICSDAYNAKRLDVIGIDLGKFNTLKNDAEFVSAIQQNTTNKKNVILRIKRAKEILLS